MTPAWDGDAADGPLETATVQCPYCFESVEIFLDPESAGEMVQDCDVCCNPWRLWVRRSVEGLTVEADRLDD